MMVMRPSVTRTEHVDRPNGRSFIIHRYDPFQVFSLDLVERIFVEAIVTFTAGILRIQ
jgi:hypothetical protein